MEVTFKKLRVQPLGVAGVSQAKAELSTLESDLVGLLIRTWLELPVIKRLERSFRWLFDLAGCISFRQSKRPRRRRVDN